MNQLLEVFCIPDFISKYVFMCFPLYIIMSYYQQPMQFIFFFLNLFIYFWLRWVFVAVCWVSLVAVSGGYSSLRCTGFPLRWLLLLRSTGSRLAGFSTCVTWAQQLWRMGLVAPRHVGSCQTRDRTRVPCTGRRILNHCATREVPMQLFFAQQTHFYQYFQIVGKKLMASWQDEQSYLIFTRLAFLIWDSLQQCSAKPTSVLFRTAPIIILEIQY